MNIKVCPVCGSQDNKYWRTCKSIILNKCNICSVVFKSDLTPDHYEEGLGRDYYEGQLNDPKDVYHKKAIYNWLKTYVNGGKMLDIGCSIGQLLQFAKNDFDIYGIDTSVRAIEHCKSAIPEGIFYCGLFEDVSLADNYFDIITMIEVIEHVSQPNIFLGKIYKKLKRGGIIFITTGNINSLQAILNRNEWHYYTNDHLLYYDIKTLSYLVEINNFTIIDKNAPVKFKYMLRALSYADDKITFVKSCIAKYYIMGHTYDGISIIAKKE